MGTNNLSVLKTYFDSIKPCSANNFVPGNMLRALTSLSLFICNYVVCCFGCILQFISRIQKADGKHGLSAQPEDSQIDGFREELINFLFPSHEHVNEFSEHGDEGTESSVSDNTDSNDFEDCESREEEEEDSSASVIEEGEKEFDGSTKINSELYDVGLKDEKEEAGSSVLMEGSSGVHENGMRRVEEITESSVAMEDIKRREEDPEEEAGMSALTEDEEIQREEEEKERPALIGNKFEYVSRRDIIGFMEEPSTTMTFSFREFFVGPRVSDTEISESKSEKGKSAGAESFPEFHLSSNGSQVEIQELESEHEPVFQEQAQKEIPELRSEEENSVAEQSFREFHPSPNGSEVEISKLKSEYEPVFQEEPQKQISKLKSEEENSIAEQSFCEFHPSPNGSGVKITELNSGQEPDFQEELQKESTQEQSSPSFHASPSVSEPEISETKSEEEEEKEGSIREQRMFHGHTSSDQFSLKSEIFHGRDSSDEDDLDFIDNSVESDSESESSSSSGLIWANSDKADDLITYEFLSYQKGFEALEPETLKLMQKLRAIDEFIELAPGKAQIEDEKKGPKDEAEKKSGELDSEEEEDDDDDFEWDDDELVEQMKMEMRNARQGGLPTILEDEEEEDEVSESPKMAEHLKPLKIEDQKLEFKDHIREIQKVHKTYEEKMRKLDILNYQTMHALGLRQLKEPNAKPMMLKNLLLWSSRDEKKKKKSSEMVVGLVEELEVVYVGHVCLSWEILCWEYKKAIELKQYDGEWVRRYNVVAGEFQLFQVLLQRFIENEPFQGPRIHNYVRNRCVIRNLLQVPAIKDDSSMKEMRKEEEEGISSERLAEIIRESMYIFCKFARADKLDHNASTFFKLPHQTKPAHHHLKDPSTSHLLSDIQTHLHKKEKRLKDIVRSGNCIVRKFQKQSEDKVELDVEQMMAQVQLKLVSRVVSMSKLRKDQLIWCHDKLHRISFVDTKVHVEPSFSLFPF